MKIKILADENISPKIVEFLNSCGIEAKRISEKRKGLKDYEIIKVAIEEKRVILTFDLDFGEMYYRSQDGKFGVWVLRIKPQTVELAIEVLKNFIETETFKKINHNKTLVILGKKKIRLRYVE